jgi:hypothetical protein
MMMRLERFSLTLLLLGVVCFVGQTNAQTTVTFQQGTDGYTGCFDRLLDIVNGGRDGSTVDTTLTSFFIDGDPDDAARADYLIRFDNIIGGGGIPAGATILDAKLTLTTTDTSVSSNSPSGESYNVYRLTQAFDSNSTLDGDFGDGDGLFTSFVDGVEPEQGECDFNVGTFDHDFDNSPMEVNIAYSADVTRAVQSWVDGDDNLGLAIMSDHTDNDDGWSVHSTGSSLTTARPILEVTYTTAAVQVFEFQQGLNGYMGTSDLFLRQENSAIDGSTVSEEFLDGDDGVLKGSNDDPYMIKFDISSITNLDEVVKAELIFKTGISSASSDSAGATEWGVHQMLVDFDPTSSQYFDYSGLFSDMVNAGEIAPVTTFFQDIDEAELMKADVTDIVKNWLENGDDNFGIYVGSHNTDNGWQIFSSGAVNPDLAPMLRIYILDENVVQGDMNGDGVFDNTDIPAFVLALTNPGLYAMMYPDVDPNVVGDYDGSGTFTNADIPGFVAALLGG